MEEYIRIGGFTERKIQMKIPRYREETRRKLREKRVNSNISNVNGAFSSQLVRGN